MGEPRRDGAGRAARRSGAQRDIGASAAVASQPPGTGELAPGVVTTLSDRVRRIIAPNPSMMTGPGTGTYLVSAEGRSDGAVAVIDPGPDDPAHLDRVAEVGAGRIRWVLVTHTHQDHSPGVAGLVARTGAVSVGLARAAPPSAGSADSGAVAGRDEEDHDGFAPVVSAGDGWALSLPGTTLRALHTPGHASNHLCWLLEEEALLFSGDHIMEGSTVVIAPLDGDMAAYLAQLERLRGLAPRAIAPGHGKLISDPAAKIDEYLVHRRAREEQVAAVLEEADTPQGVDALVARIYTGVPEALHPVARYSVWAHLRKLGDEGRAFTPDRDDVTALWSSTRPNGGN